MPKKNGFFYFMLEYKQRKQADGRSVLSLALISADAGKIWEKMNAAQREPYIHRAKSVQNEGGLEKLNSLGIAISEIDKQLRSKEEHVQMINKLVADRVARAESRKELAKEVVYIISLSYFGHAMQNKYIPAELGVVKYSLQCGVIDRLHMYFNPGEIPLGAAHSVLTHTKETHQLPLPPDAWGTTDKNEVAVALISFLGAENEIPPLFTDEETLPIVEGMLRDLLDDCIENKMLYVCPMSELLCRLKQATERHFEGKATFPSALTAQHILKMDSYGFALGISCEYHERELNVLNCALSQATRWAYTLSKYCCLHMGIECVPGKHIPPDPSAGDNKASKPLTTSESNSLEKPGTSHDASAGDKVTSSKQAPNWFNKIKMRSASKDESSYKPLTGSVSYMPQKGGVVAYTGINLETDSFYEQEQNNENVFPTLLQSMGRSVKGRGHAEKLSDNSQQAVRGRGRGRGRGYNAQQRGN
ncbi:protein maelstrom homolog [Anopheles moucheti]|uniref:protein maelstrom homolog n=1 Tax=Anopheles moucheti TaxID=186751 RepID=UPI0022F0E725|nr:protein maelstrom homolog [Anopheles moucheti]